MLDTEVKRCEHVIKSSKAVATRDAVIADVLLMTPAGINLADLRFGHLIPTLLCSIARLLLQKQPLSACSISS